MWTRQKKLDGSNGTCKVSKGNVTLLLRYSKVTGKLLESYWKVTAKLLESYLNVTPAVHMTCVARGYKGGSLTQRLPVNAAPLESSLRAETLKPSLVPYARYGTTAPRARAKAASLLSASYRLRGAWPQSERRTQMINWVWLLLASALLLQAPQLCAPSCATLNALALVRRRVRQ